jgi:methionyl-tRNA formyltransferase
MRVAFAGTPVFAAVALKKLLAAKYPIVGVLTQPDRPAGRGRQLTPSPVKETALLHNLPIAQPLSLRTSEGQAALVEWRADALVVVAYGLILPTAVLQLPRLGCINIHASLLPRWRGAAPIQRAILAGDQVTGITLMQMDEGLDTGPIFMQRQLTIDSAETSQTLHDRLAQLGADMLLELLPQLAGGAISPQLQSAVGVTYAAKLSKAEASIDWQCSAEQLARNVRAYQPWPLAHSRFAGQEVKILAAKVRSHDSALVSEIGQIYAFEEDALWVQCGSGSLGITQLQRAGRRAVTARDFANTCTVLQQRFE